MRSAPPAKFYDCDASEAWRSYGPPREELPPDDRLRLKAWRRDKMEDQAGQRYRCIVFRDGRELVTQRTRLDMDAPAIGTSCMTTPTLNQRPERPWK